jgi:hypothetical protein
MPVHGETAFVIEDDKEDKPLKKKSAAPLVIVIVVLVLAIGAGVAFMVMRRDKTTTPETGGTVIAKETAAGTTTPVAASTAAATGAAAPVATSTGVATAAVKIEDPMKAKARKAFKDAAEFAEGNPDSFAAAISRFEKVRSEYPDTDWAKKAAQHIEAVKKKREDKALALIESLREKIKPLLKERRFKQIFKLYLDFPKELQDTRAFKDSARFREKLRKRMGGKRKRSRPTRIKSARTRPQS